MENTNDFIFYPENGFEIKRITFDEVKKMQALSYYNCLEEENRFAMYKQLDFYFNKAQTKLDALAEKRILLLREKNFRYYKKDSPLSIEYINLMKDINLLMERMKLFDEQIMMSHQRADYYKNDYVKLENLFTLLNNI